MKQTYHTTESRSMRAPHYIALLAGLVTTGATVAILAGDAIVTGKW